MRLVNVCRRSLAEFAQERLMLALSLVFAPFFVFLYWLFFPSGSTTYDVLVLNQDHGAALADGTPLTAGTDVLATLAGVTYADGKPLLVVREVPGRDQAVNLLRNRDAEVLLIIPEDFSEALAAAADGQPFNPAAVTFEGDLTNPYYAVGAIMASGALEAAVLKITGQPRPIEVVERPLGSSGARSEFENYVPGLLVFAVIMLIFLAAMTITREVESGTLRRLQTTPMRTADFLGGHSAAIALIGAASVLLTFATAAALGFRSQGPLWVAVFIGVVTSLAVVGAGLLVACFSRSVNQAFLIANFPLVLFMFFSGAIFPMPRLSLFTLGDRAVSLYDLLPPTHAVVALNKVLTLGGGLADVLYEIAALLALSVLYFAVGVWLFRRRHLRAR